MIRSFQNFRENAGGNKKNKNGTKFYVRYKRFFNEVYPSI